MDTLKGPVGPFFALDCCPYLARFQTSRAVPDPSDVVGVVHFSSLPEIVKGQALLQSGNARVE